MFPVFTGGPKSTPFCQSSICMLGKTLRGSLLMVLSTSKFKTQKDTSKSAPAVIPDIVF